MKRSGAIGLLTFGLCVITFLYGLRISDSGLPLPLKEVKRIFSSDEGRAATNGVTTVPNGPPPLSTPSTMQVDEKQNPYLFLLETQENAMPFIHDRPHRMSAYLQHVWSLADDTLLVPSSDYGNPYFEIREAKDMAYRFSPQRREEKRKGYLRNTGSALFD